MRIFSFLLLFLFLSSTLASQKPDIETEPVIVVFGHKYPPFNYFENNIKSGIKIEITKELFEKRLGLPVEYHYLPWKRAQFLFKEKRADVIFTIPTADRKKIGTPVSSGLLKVKNSLYTYRENPNIQFLKRVKNIEDLKKFKLVDYLGDGWAQQNFTGHQVEWLGELEQVIKFLALKRAEVFVQADVVTDYEIKKANLQDLLVKLPNVLSNEEHTIIIRKGSHVELLADNINREVQKMIADGTLDKILSKYK